MQDKPNRPSSKSYTLVEPYQRSSIEEARELVQNAVIAYPDTATIHLAELLDLELDLDFRQRLDSSLRRAFLYREIRAERSRCKQNLQLPLPGFEHLPRVLHLPKKDPISILDANYRTIRNYYWYLMRRYAEKKRSDPKIKEAKALLDLMTARVHTERGITVREVILLEP